MSSQYEKRKAKINPASVVETPTPVGEYPMDKIALDVFFDPATKKFMKVTLEYNLTSGKGRVSNCIAIADSQPVAIVKMGESINRKILNLPQKADK